MAAASPSELRQRKSAQREGDLIAMAAAGEAPPLAILVQKASPALEALAQVINVLGPVYGKAFDLGVRAYQTAPVDLIQAATGLGLAFFGGAFCTSIAAMEAFNLATWSTTRAAVEDIYADVLRIAEAQAADAKKDDDGDGVADVKQSTPAEARARATAAAPPHIYARHAPPHAARRRRVPCRVTWLFVPPSSAPP
jgi:hypothetical protein